MWHAFVVSKPTRGAAENDQVLEEALHSRADQDGRFGGLAGADFALLCHGCVWSSKLALWRYIACLTLSIYEW